MEDLFNKEMPLAAIWLKSSVALVNWGEERNTPRIEAGDEIRIEDGWIVDIQEGKPPTHKVTECKGNIANTILYFELKDLATGEKIILNMK